MFGPVIDVPTLADRLRRAAGERELNPAEAKELLLAAANEIEDWEQKWAGLRFITATEIRNLRSSDSYSAATAPLGLGGGFL